MARAWHLRALHLYIAAAGTILAAYDFLPENIDSALYAAMSTAAAVGLAIGASRATGRTRLVWACLAVGQGFFGIADTLWMIVQVWLGEVPFPSPMDGFYLAYYPMVTLGMVLLIRRRSPRRQILTAIDTLTAVTAAMLVLWSVWLHVLSQNDPTALGRVVSLIYPVADFGLVVCALRLAIGPGRWTVPVRLLIGSQTCTIVADLLYLSADPEKYHIGHLLDLIWMVGFLTFGIAALQPDSGRLAEHAEASGAVGAAAQRPARVALSGLIPLAIVVISSVTNSGMNLAVFVGGSSGLYLLVVTRLMLVMRWQERRVTREQTLQSLGVNLVAAHDVGAVERAVADVVAGLAGMACEITVMTDPAAVALAVATADLGSADPAPAPGQRNGPDGGVIVLPLVVRDEPRGALRIVPSRPPDQLAREALAAMATRVALSLDSIAIAQDLRASESRFRSIVDASSDIMWITGADGRVTWVGDSVERILGYPTSAVLGSYVRALVHPDDLESSDRFRALARLPGSELVTDCRLRRSDDTYAVFQITGRDLSRDPAVSGTVYTGLDVTERRALEDQLRDRAFHDPLTQLANRALFVDRLEHALDRRLRDGQQIAVLFVDLDDFKTVNDGLGHLAGDQLLLTVAERLTSTLRADDTAARFGGDEFAVLLEETDTERAAVLADRIVVELSKPFDVADREVFIGASIGVAIVTDEASDPDTLLRNADMAMYQAKNAGKGRSEIFHASMHVDAMRRLELQADLQRALDRDELVVYYQPIVDLATERLTGFEALVRWQHPTRGLLGPMEFVPMAEETGLIVSLGRWVLRSACAQIRLWQEHYRQPLTIAVNVSVRQFVENILVDDVTSALADSGLAPEHLTLEVTESLFMTDLDTTVDRLRVLKLLGVRLSIDDFGTGYSSLSYLERLPIDVLKIDQSFVSMLLEPDREPTVIYTILDLGRRLGVSTVAEGIEEVAQLTALRGLGCQFGQGYLFATPLEPRAAAAYIAADAEKPASRRSA